jgi:probable DNA repair protein
MSISTEIQDLLRDGWTVLTPSAAIARAVREGYESSISGVVPSPRVLTIDAWIRERWLEESWDSGESVLLTAAQELQLWQQVILESEEAERLLQIPAAARLAADAWRIQQSWQLPVTAASMDSQEDTAAYFRWSRVFAQRCEKKHWIDRARLAGELSRAGAGGERVAVAGFTVLLPQHRAMLDRVVPGWRDVRAFDGPCTPVAGKAEFTTTEAETRTAAVWAREVMLANPGERIGVVCLDLASKRRLIDRIFLEVFHPEQLCFVSESSVERRRYQFESGGDSLAGHPMIHTALLALDLAGGELTLAESGSLLRSPFLGRGFEERAARAVLDATLRRNHPAWLSIQEITEQARQKAPVMASLLAKFDKLRRALPKSALPGSWASHLSRLLRTLEWPGSDTLSPAESEVFEAWQETLSEFAALDAVTGSMPLGTAIRTLGDLARSRAIPGRRDGRSGVAILSLEDALGAPFDHLWVLGCTSDAWPPPPRPNPFLPVVLQRARGVPSSSPESELQFASAATRALIENCSVDIVFSYARREADRELRESALLSRLSRLPVEEQAPGASLQRAAFEEVDDAQAPPLVAGSMQRGGTRILQLQAACPFRAFAELRLGARGMERGEAGLNPRDRGKLLHETLRLVWEQLQTSTRLQHTPPAELDEMIRGAIRQSQWPGRDAFEREVLQLEAVRLHELVKSWLLEVERKRGTFVVVGQEQAREVEFGTLKFQARVDRVDRFPDGTEAILDHKTGEVASNPWDGERPAEPQLPAYAVSHPAKVSGLVFAKVSKSRLNLDGIGPGTPNPGDAPPIEEWRKVLTKLADDFAAGVAAVDPKDISVTCQYCDADVICRVSDSHGD